MRVWALVDFGSTFTKVTLVEEGSGRLLSRADHPTTVDTDVIVGYRCALDRAMSRVSGKADLTTELAASSAGGGLQVAAAGLVAELTASAAQQAALNAGAKVRLVLAGDLDDTHRATLANDRPEILLFCGGTDGGQVDKVLHNADVLAAVDNLDNVIVACNSEIAPDVARRFQRPGRSVQVVANVLPDVDRLDIEPARRVIHETFIHHVIRGKHLSAGPEFEAMVTMPTPEAVIEAVRLLAFGRDGTAETNGVIVVDIGGATTDVHSAAPLGEQPSYITRAGLPGLSVMRSVQGDLGMRWGADSVVAADQDWMLAELAPVGVDSASLQQAVLHRRSDPEFIAADDVAQRIDDALATSCLSISLRRHCGTLNTVYSPGRGTQFVQRGVDLRNIPLMIGTGGPLVHGRDSCGLLQAAVARRSADSLSPTNPTIVIDRNYLLAAAGLLASRDPEAAEQLLGLLWKGSNDTDQDL